MGSLGVDPASTVAVRPTPYSYYGAAGGRPGEHRGCSPHIILLLWGRWGSTRRAPWLFAPHHTPTMGPLGVGPASTVAVLPTSYSYYGAAGGRPGEHRGSSPHT